MSREALVAEIDRRLALFAVTRRPADYPMWLIMQAMRNR